MNARLLNSNSKQSVQSTAYDAYNRRVLLIVTFGTYCCFIAFYFLSQTPIVLKKQSYGRIGNASSVIRVGFGKVSTSKTVFASRPGLPPRFVYHALHKTGSALTRAQIKRICAELKLECFTFRSCVPTDRQVHTCHFKADHQAYIAGNNRSGLDIENGSLTKLRMQKCCPKSVYTKQWHALNEHMTMAEPENREFVDQRFPLGSKAVRFTIIRDPLAQFVSNYNYVKIYVDGILNRLEAQLNQKQPASARTQAPMPMPSMATLINKFYEMAKDPKVKQTATQRERRFYAILTNSQSKELGWQESEGPSEHGRALKYLEQLDSVGITTKMAISYKMFRKLLGLPSNSKFFVVKPVSARSPSKVEKLSPQQKDRLRFIQRYDLMLYNRTKELFMQRCAAGNFGSRQECHLR